MKVLQIGSNIIEPESANPDGVTQLSIWLEFEGREVYFDETIEGMHGEWASRLVAKLKEVLDG